MRCCLPVSLVLYGMPCYTPSFPSAVRWPVCVRPRAGTALRGSAASRPCVSIEIRVCRARGRVVRGAGCGERDCIIFSRGKTTIANVYKSRRKGL